MAKRKRPRGHLSLQHLATKGPIDQAYFDASITTEWNSAIDRANHFNRNRRDKMRPPNSHWEILGWKLKENSDCFIQRALPLLWQSYIFNLNVMVPVMEQANQALNAVFCESIIKCVFDQCKNYINIGMYQFSPTGGNYIYVRSIILIKREWFFSAMESIIAYNHYLKLQPQSLAINKILIDFAIPNQENLIRYSDWVCSYIRDDYQERRSGINDAVHTKAITSQVCDIKTRSVRPIQKKGRQ